MKVEHNPYMTFEELYNIMYTKDAENIVNDWVRFTLDAIHTRDIYIVHDPIADCYCNRYVEDYNSVKDMEEEMKVKPLTLLGVL